MLARSLAESFQVLVATNGRAAVCVYEQHGEEIVALVTDVEMPHLDGNQASSIRDGGGARAAPY